MVYRFRSFLHLCRRFNSFLNISRTNIMNSQKCYFSYVDGEEKVDVTFLLPVKESKRQFNFSRKTSEDLKTLCLRIGINVQKAISKANKKKTKNAEDCRVTFLNVHNEAVSEDLKCVDIFSLPGPLKLNICDQLFEIVLNAPWVSSISLPQSILAGFPVYPENFVIRFASKQACQYNWFKGETKNSRGTDVSEVHIKWQHVGDNFTYTPSASDIGMKLKLECIPVNEQTVGPVVEVISKNVIEAGPGQCPFEIRQKFTTQKLSKQCFRCVTYNILADLYCDSDYTRTVLHPYCPPYALHIDYRKQLVIKELLGYNADIICLQEVDRKIFKSHLVPLLETDSFDGLFYKKGKEVAEGLACFYRNNRFRLLDHDSIVLSEAVKTYTCLRPIWEKAKQNIKLLERLLERSTVASYTVLQSTDNSNEIVLVGNTHLYFHPDADHIRLIQGGIVIYWLRYIKESLIEKYPNKRISLILCGDFNSVPSCGIYQLYTSGMANTELPDWRSNVEEEVKGLSLEQDIILGSACGTPQFTNFTVGFADCLDYIFYEKSNLTVDQVIPLPSLEEITAHTALPSIVFPSDHIALISDLRFV